MLSLTFFCEHPSTSDSGTLTMPSTSTTDSRVTLDAYLTIPLVTVVSFTNMTACASRNQKQEGGGVTFSACLTIPSVTVVSFTNMTACVSRNQKQQDGCGGLRMSAKQEDVGCVAEAEQEQINLHSLAWEHQSGQCGPVHTQTACAPMQQEKDKVGEPKLASSGTDRHTN